MQSLLKRGFSPTIESVRRLLSSLLRGGKYQLLLHVYSQFTSNTAGKTSHAVDHLVFRALLKTGRFKEAEDRLAKNIDSRHFFPSFLRDALIRGICVAEKDPERAFALLVNYSRYENAHPPSRHVFRSLIFGFGSVGRMDRAIEVLETMTSASIGYNIDNYVSSSIISGFCKAGKPELGLDFFEKFRNDPQFVPNLMTYTSLLDALLRCKKIEEASDLVQGIEAMGLTTDAILYACWASGCIKNSDLGEALHKHKLMVERSIAPDVVNYSVIVDGFCKVGNMEKVIGLLEMMKVKGIVPNLITYTSIIQGFCKRGKLDEATALLRKLQELHISIDEFAYATLINGCCEEGEMEMVFKLLDEMEEKGIEIGAITLNIAIDGLCKVGDMTKANQLLSASDGNIIALSTILSGHLRDMNESSVLTIAKKMEANKMALDLAGCNVLIRAYFFLGMFEDALFLFRRMPEMGLAPSSITFMSVIDGCCKLGMMDEALEITDEYASIVSESDLGSLGSMIIGLCKRGMLEAAAEVFRRLSSKGIALDPSIHQMLIKMKYREDQGEEILKLIRSLEAISKPDLLSLICNDAIAFLCRNRCCEAAKELFILARRRLLGITESSYFLLVKSLLRHGHSVFASFAMSTCIREYGLSESKMMMNMLALFLCKINVEKALQFLNSREKTEILSSVSTAIVESLKKDGRADDAYKLVMEAKENRMTVDLVTYSILIDGLSKEGHLEKALMLCSKIRDEGVKPNIYIYNSILNGLCRQGCLVEAMRIFDALGPCNVVPTVVTYDTLIRGLVAEGHLADARDLFEEMNNSGLVPNLRVYNTMINGYCSFGSVGEAVELLLRMEEGSMKPDSFTFSSLVNGFCVVGDMEGALEFYTEYKKKGVSLDFLGFLHLIEGLLSKGRMEEARSVLWDTLQCQSIAEALNKKEIEIEGGGGSLLHALKFLCQEGRIDDAIVVLTEVGLVKSSSGRFIGSCRSAALRRAYKGKKYFNVENKAAESSREENGSPISCDSGVGSHQKSWDVEALIPGSKFLDFDDYYPVVASLCVSGELQKASYALKYVMANSGKHP